MCSNYNANFLLRAANEEFFAVVAEGKWVIRQRKENALELGVEIDKIIQEKLVELFDELDRLVEKRKPCSKDVELTRVFD